MGHSGGSMPTGEGQARRLPAHAGSLRRWERYTIVLVFLLVATIIAVIMVMTGRPHSAAPRVRRGSAPVSYRPTHQSGAPAGVPAEPRPRSVRRDDDRLNDLVGKGLAFGVPEREQPANVADNGIDEVADVPDEGHGHADRLTSRLTDQA